MFGDIRFSKNAAVNSRANIGLNTSLALAGGLLAGRIISNVSSLHGGVLMTSIVLIGSLAKVALDRLIPPSKREASMKFKVTYITLGILSAVAATVVGVVLSHALGFPALSATTSLKLSGLAAVVQLAVKIPFAMIAKRRNSILGHEAK